MENLFPSMHWTNLLVIPSLLIGYTVHELGHALTAYFLGDYSQVERGKITLNPFRHIPWLGFLCFLLFGFGWPKPVYANRHNFKRQYLDMAIVAVSGPFASFMLGVVGLLATLVVAAALVYTSGATTDRVFPFLFPSVFPFLFPMMSELPESVNVQAWSISLTGYIAATSFWLTLISLLPLPGLDGYAALINLIAFFQKDKQKTTTTAQLQSVLLADQPITLASQRKRRNSAAAIHFEAGAEYHQEKQYEDAIARYRQAISNDQNFGPAYINMGLAFLAKGDRKKALQAFRGATQYADDEKSEGQAWAQLHRLSQVNPVDEEEAQENMAEMGASPWIDTKPRPNWLGLGVSGVLLFASGIFLYGYLFTNLVELLQN